MGPIQFKIWRVIENLFPRMIHSKTKIDMLKYLGVDVGEGTALFNAGSITFDTTRPLLLKIGKYCKITEGTVILTHDYSRSVIRRKYGEVIGEAKPTVIGDNVFIGINSIILMGTEIGSNCIVGAGSVCSGKYPDNSVICGNPARVLCSIDDHYIKRKNRYVDEAKYYAKLYKERLGRFPTIKEMDAFFPIYLERSSDALIKSGVRTNLSGDIEAEVIDAFLHSKGQYNSYQEFLEDC